MFILWKLSIGGILQETFIMETNKILSANLLDILFDGRNKDYGAYELRKNYNGRMMSALLATFLFIAIAIFGKVLNDKFTTTVSVIIPETREYILSETPKDEKKVVVIVEKKAAGKKIKSEILTKPVITKETDIPVPPDMKLFDDAVIDTKKVDGVAFTGITPLADVIEGPLSAGKAAVVIPIPENPKNDEPLTSVDIQASFPGGITAWQKYLTRKISTQLDDPDDKDFGTVNVRFVVDSNGRVSNVMALNMINTSLAEVAVNAIRKGPDWLPAKQNGQYVKAYRTQPITLTKPY